MRAKLKPNKCTKISIDYHKIVSEIIECEQQMRESGTDDEKFMFLLGKKRGLQFCLGLMNKKGDT